MPFTTSGQETERVYSYNPGAHTGQAPENHDTPMLLCVSFSLSSACTQEHQHATASLNAAAKTHTDREMERQLENNWKAGTDRMPCSSAADSEVTCRRLLQSCCLITRRDLSASLHPSPNSTKIPLQQCTKILLTGRTWSSLRKIGCLKKPWLGKQPRPSG